MTGRAWRHLLIAVAAIALYALAAFGLVTLLPEFSWPAIGDEEFSSGQASVVPAVNVFAAGAIGLALFGHLVPTVVRVILDVLLGVVAAAAGPALAMITGYIPDAQIITPGTLAMAAVGVIATLSCTFFSRSREASGASATEPDQRVDAPGAIS